MSWQKATDRPSGGRVRAAGIACLAFALCLLSFACEKTDVHPDFHFLIGKVVASDGVSIVPDWRWRTHQESGGSFRKHASFLVWVETAADEDLVFSLTPDGASDRLHFMVSWDGDPLWVAPRSGGDGPFEIEIQRSLLTPGAHRLTVTRSLGDTEDSDLGESDSTFSHVRVLGKQSARVLVDGIRSDLFLAAFLEYGVTGRSPVRRDGMLFIGPRRLQATMQVAQGSEASFLLHNNSQGESLFRISIGEEEPLEFKVRADAQLPVEFDFPPGVHRTVFEVDGSNDGSFLWGSPYLTARDLEETAPPIIFMTLDTTRWDAVAPFSEYSDITPNLAAFASRATIFWHAWATAPWTLPSHASMFTGLYPSHHGAGVTSDALPLDAVTLAELLRQRGYRTAGFIGGPLAGAMFGMSQGFSEYHDPEKWERPADEVTEAALRFLTDHTESRIFLFVNYFDPHAPYEAPEAFRRLIRGNEASGVSLDGLDGGKTGRPGAVSAPEVGQDDAQSPGSKDGALRNAYLAEVAFMDSEIGRLFDGLRRLGLYDEAMIVAVSDHGEFLGENGLYGHSYRLDPELTRVPLLIKWPHQDEAEVVTDLVSHVDLFATVGAAAGVVVPPSDGRRLSRAPRATSAGRELVFMEEHSSRIHPLTGPNKLADHLFGLQWHERRELIIGPRIECQIRSEETWMTVPCGIGREDPRARLSDQMRAVASLEVSHSASDLERDELEKLRALGYLE